MKPELTNMKLYGFSDILCGWNLNVSPLLFLTTMNNDYTAKSMECIKHKFVVLYVYNTNIFQCISNIGATLFEHVTLIGVFGQLKNSL